MGNNQTTEVQKEKRLLGKLMNVSELSSEQKIKMLHLLKIYFDNVKEALFFKDLSEKEWVIIFEDIANGEIQGFSTQTLIDAEIDTISIKALFSGDTIIDKNYWGSRELPRVWGKLVSSLMKKFEGIKLYWFYISKGYMTYLLMPRYFHNFYPKYDSEIPEFEKKVLDTLASKKFGSGYDSKRGIVTIEFNYYLRMEVGQITEDLLKDPNIRFFKSRNPNYIKGEELACLVKLTEDNMQLIFKQIINDEK
ncbi:MAG: hypothetical protein AABX78_02240 [Nanoarchaeota archaeon]